MTKYAALPVILSLAAASRVPAQSNGYGFAAFGRETGYSSYFHGGIGGDWVIRRGFGAGGEIGGVTGRRVGAPNFALLSGNGSYHLPTAKESIDPFITGGISIVTTGGSGDLLWNWGGGANWWLRSRLGVRFEFRDHVWTTASRHLAEFRVGLSFR
jgi:hypothetical protein